MSEAELEALRVGDRFEKTLAEPDYPTDILGWSDGRGNSYSFRLGLDGKWFKVPFGLPA